jgi:hypothetical protein
MTWKSIQQIAGRVRWLGALMLELQAQRTGRFDSRAVARTLRVSVDEVNVALTDLCLFGLVELKGE